MISKEDSNLTLTEQIQLLLVEQEDSLTTSSSQKRAAIVAVRGRFAEENGTCSEVKWLSLC